MKRYWWTTGSGRIELQIAMEDAEYASHTGSCDPEVYNLRTFEPYIKRQLDALAPSVVRDELREYGAWDYAELADHDANLSRLLWLACCNIAEGEGEPVEVEEVTP